MPRRGTGIKVEGGNLLWRVHRVQRGPALQSSCHVRPGARKMAVSRYCRNSVMRRASAMILGPRLVESFWDGTRAVLQWRSGEVAKWIKADAMNAAFGFRFPAGIVRRSRHINSRKKSVKRRSPCLSLRQSGPPNPPAARHVWAALPAAHSKRKVR